MLGTPLAEHCRKTTAQRNIAHIWMKFSGKVRINGRKKGLDLGSDRTNNDYSGPMFLTPMISYCEKSTARIWMKFLEKVRINGRKKRLYFGSNRTNNDSISPPCF